jgi:protein SCO1/2
MAASRGRCARPLDVSRRSLIALLALVAASLIALAAVARDRQRDGPSPIVQRQEGPFRAGPLPQGLDRKPAPGFRLADARGGTLDSRALRGRPYVLTFLFTDCRDVCPLIGREIGEALRLLGPQANEVAAVAVTVDPEGDTRRAVRAWLRKQRLPDNFHYLIGSRGQLKPVWRAYFAAPQPPGTEVSRHTASIWVIGARGRLRAKFSGGIPVRPRDIAHDLRLLVREARSSAEGTES